MRELALVVSQGVVVERRPVHIATRSTDTEFDYASWNAAMNAAMDKVAKPVETKEQLRTKVEAKIAKLEQRYFKVCSRRVTKKYTAKKKAADKWVIANLIIDQEEKLVDLA